MTAAVESPLVNIDNFDFWDLSDPVTIRVSAKTTIPVATLSPMQNVTIQAYGPSSPMQTTGLHEIR